MNDKLLVLVGILLMVILYVFNQKETFSNSDTDNKLKNKIKIKSDDKELELIAFSQLKNELKNELIKSYLLDSNVSISKIFDKELSAVLKFIETNKKLTPESDIIIGVKSDDLKELTNEEYIGINNLNNPIYNIGPIFSRNAEQKFSYKEDILIISANKNAPSIEIKEDIKKKIGDKFINLIPGKLANKEIYFIKLSERKSILNNLKK